VPASRQDNAPPLTPSDLGAWLALSEMTHRVANEYAMAIASISRAAATSESLEVKAALAGAARRLRNYAEAHRALQPPLTADQVSLADYLGRLCTAISRARLRERNISLTLVEEEIDVEADRAWRAALIVSEWITNAARHAFGVQGGAILVELCMSGGMVHCSVADNGRSAARPKDGHGARIVAALAEELGGAVGRRFTAHGTIAELLFPAATSGLTVSAARQTLTWPGELRAAG
jgi:two-component sensor histidine kinase